MFERQEKDRGKSPWSDALSAEIEVAGEKMRALREKFNEIYGEEKKKGSGAVAGGEVSPWRVEKGGAVEQEEKNDVALRAMQGSIYNAAKQLGIRCVVEREGDSIRVSPESTDQFENTHALIKVLAQEAVSVLENDGLPSRFLVTQERGDIVVSL